jgi:hypothetical protein
MGLPDKTAEAFDYCAQAHAHKKTPLYMLGDGTTIQNIFNNLNFESWDQRFSFQVLFIYLETIWSFVQSLYHTLLEEQSNQT